MLATAIILVVLALIIYTVAVWSVKKAGVLKKWHVPVFWAGFVCDFSGTALMAALRGGPSLSLHGMVGYPALLVMAFTSIAATLALRADKEKARARFPALGLVAWVIWLASFLTGMILNMRG